MTNHPFALLHSLPFFSEVILSSDDISSASGHHSLLNHRYRHVIEILIQKIALFENRYLKQQNRAEGRLLRSTIPPIPNDPATFFEAFSSERVATFISCLLDYKLLDILIALELGFHCHGQVERRPIPLPPKIHFKLASNWPQLISKSLSILNEYDTTTISSEQGGPLSIFSSLANRSDQIDAHKIIANFECAAAYLSLIHKGVTDLPGTLPAFKELLLRTFPDPDGTVSSESWDRLFETIKTTHSFKLPLQLAVSFSPVCLFFPSLLMSKDLNRTTLFWIWRGLGGPRGAQLLEVERETWISLNDIASGEVSMWPRLRTFFRYLGSLPLAGVSLSNASWLSGDSSFFENRTAGEIAALDSDLHHQHATLQQALPPSRIILPCDLRRPITRSVTASATMSAGQSRAPATPSPYYIGRTSAQKRRTQTVAPRHDLDKSADLPLKRAASEGLPRGSQALYPKRRRAYDGTPIRVVDIIDLTLETSSQPIDLTLEEDATVTHHVGRSFVVPKYNGTFSFKPRFRFKAELDAFESLLSKAIHSMSITFDIRPFSSLSCLNALEAQSIFGKKCVVGYGGPLPGYGFNEDGFRTLTMHNLEKVVVVYDFSIPPNEDRRLHGSLHQLLQDSRRGFKPLKAPHFPMPNGVTPPSVLLSDMVAWDYMVGTPWCGLRWDMPRGALKWGAAFTSGAFSPLRFSTHGFSAYMEVKVGSMVVVAVTPKGDDPKSFPPMTFVKNWLRDPFNVDTKDVTVDIYPLEAGTSFLWRPNTACAFLCVENSIMHNSYFLSSSTIRLTCYGVLQSFAICDSITEEVRHASWTILRRMVHFYHYVLSRFSGQDFAGFSAANPEIIHALDPNTSDGIVDILTISNLMELANVLSLETYTHGGISEFQRQHFIEARRLCRRMITRIGSLHTFRTPTGDHLDLYDDIWMPYLLHHVEALKSYRNEASAVRTNVISDQALEASIRICFEDNSSFQGLRRLPPITPGFAWPAEFAFDFAPRPSPLPVDLDAIDGYTGEDRHFYSFRRPTQLPI